MSSRHEVQDATGIVSSIDQNARLHVFGRGAPTNAQAGFSPGCFYQDVTNAEIYFNDGSLTSTFWLRMSQQLVNLTTTPITLALPSQGGSIITLNKATGIAITLPAATGTLASFRFFVGTTVSGGSHTIVCAGSDVFKGSITYTKTSTHAVTGWTSTANTTITMDGNNQGGIAGDWVEILDVAAAVWSVRGGFSGDGTAATSFS